MINWKLPINSSNLKSKVDRLDVDKLVPVPVYLSKLSDIVKNDHIMLRSKMLKMKYLILLTELLILS